MDMNLKSSTTGGMSLVVGGEKDAKSLLRYIFRTTQRFDGGMSVSFGLGLSNINGWGLEKSEDGYCFWLACNAPFNGFTVRPGFWAYRVGKSWVPCRWYGGGDFAWRPKQMFLPCDVTEKLVLQLCRNEPFHYDPEHWVNTDDCDLEPPTTQ